LWIIEEARIYGSHSDACVVDEYVDALPFGPSTRYASFDRALVTNVKGAGDAEDPSCDAIVSARPRSRPVTITRAPDSTRATAIAAPRPLVAPVTRTRVPLNSVI
jgi:hypothetical protein